MDGATVRLSDQCDLVSEPVKPGEWPDALFLGLEHLAPGRLVRIGGGQASEMRSNTSAFQPGDVLYGKLRPYLDKAILADQSGVCTTELLVLRAKTDVNPRFLAATLHSPRFLEHAVAGTTGVQHPRTSWAHIREFELPAFTLEEQHQVAGLLWLVHEVIAQSETLVEEGRALKRAAMQTLFTRGLRGEAQKETEIGPVPESWELNSCGQIFNLTSGRKRPTTLSEEPYDERPFPVLGGNGVMGFADEWFLDAPQTLVIGRVGEYCGAVHVTSGKVWITDNALYAKEWLREDAELKFVSSFLEYFDLNRFKRMAGQPLVTQGLINEHYVPLPGISEQRETVAILDAIDRKIDLHRRKRAVLEELFKALLHKLMTGEIRVGDLDFSNLSISSTSVGEDE